MVEPNDPITTVPTRYPVKLLVERRAVRGNPWVAESWRAVGVTLDGAPATSVTGPIEVVAGEDASQFLWRGLWVELFLDEAESYYHNLTVPEPACYAVCRNGPAGVPTPFLVTVSFDAAQAYGEGDETVFGVPLPPELYRATEAFVLAHYVPEKRRKRSLDNWKEQGHG